MTDQVKVLIGERNGAELADKEELSLVAQNIYLDHPEFDDNDVLSALIEALKNNKYVHSANWLIDENKRLTIQYDKQMNVRQRLEVCGQLILEGYLSVD